MLFATSTFGLYTPIKYTNLKYCRKIVELFLNDQSSVTIFNSMKANNFYDDSIIKAMETVLPALIYSSINESLADSINDMGDELNVPSNSKSYFGMTNSVEWIFDHLKHFARINTNGKWMFFVEKVKRTDIELLIVSAFKNHKMLNVLIIFVDLNLNIFVASYNPFELVSNNQRGEIWIKEVKQENLPEILPKIDKICEKKVENLHEFELSVSTFYEPSKMSKLTDEPIPFLFQKALNCKYRYFETAGNIYGSRLPNGSLTGEM